MRIIIYVSYISTSFISPVSNFDRTKHVYKAHWLQKKKEDKWQILNVYMKWEIARFRNMFLYLLWLFNFLL